MNHLYTANLNNEVVAFATSLEDFVQIIYDLIRTTQHYIFNDFAQKFEENSIWVHTIIHNYIYNFLGVFNNQGRVLREGAWNLENAVKMELMELISPFCLIAGQNRVSRQVRRLTLRTLLGQCYIVLQILRFYLNNSNLK